MNLFAITQSKTKIVAVVCALPLMLAACAHVDRDGNPMGAEDKLPPGNCHSTKEYISAYKYLHSKSDELVIAEPEIRKLASEIASGCTGSASRFIRSFELLWKVEVGGRAAAKIASRLANKSDAHADAFIEIFKRSFLAEHLDLDLHTAMTMAQELSVDFKGNNVQQAMNDFSKLTDFCTSNKDLNLPLAFCGQAAATITKAGEDFNEPMFEAFKEVFSYTHQQLGVNVLTSFKVAHKVVRMSPHAFSNFKEAYEWSLKQNAMDLSAPEALSFALSMAEKTRAPYATMPPERLPAGDSSTP